MLRSFYYYAHNAIPLFKNGAAKGQVSSYHCDFIHLMSSSRDLCIVSVEVVLIVIPQQTGTFGPITYPLRRKC